MLFPRPGGETGRHKGLKIPRRKRCTGSIPVPGTTAYSRRLFPIHSLYGLAVAMQAFSPFTPRTFALIGKHQSPEVADSLRQLAEFLDGRGLSVLIEEETAAKVKHQLRGVRYAPADYPAIGASADLAIVVGGDGTMLGAARQLARYRVPLVGVNLGRLGFMTDIARSNMLDCMVDLLDGRFQPETRLLLDTELVRDGRVMAEHVVLNDVVVDKGPIGRMLEFELWIDDEFIYQLRADGLIVSTPTGSTAYALSANGPILHPSLGGIALVPLCPHSLTNRPITVSDKSDIEIRITHAEDARVHLDGQVSFDLRAGDRVRVRRSGYNVCFLHPPGYSYFAMLRQKLHWNERLSGA